MAIIWEGFVPAHVASLGAWCQTTFQIKALGLPVVSSPFDWIVTPLDTLIMMLDEGCVRCADAVSLRRGGLDPVCDVYGAVYAHEFPHSEGVAIEITSEGCARVKSKMLHKMGRLRSAAQSGEPILFIRLGGHATPAIPWPYLLDDKPLLADDCRRLEQSLHKLCGHDNFRLLIAGFTETTTFPLGPISSRTQVRAIQWPKIHPSSWEGEREDWELLTEGVL